MSIITNPEPEFNRLPSSIVVNDGDCSLGDPHDIGLDRPVIPVKSLNCVPTKFDLSDIECAIEELTEELGQGGGISAENLELISYLMEMRASRLEKHRPELGLDTPKNRRPASPVPPRVGREKLPTSVRAHKIRRTHMMKPEKKNAPKTRV